MNKLAEGISFFREGQFDRALEIFNLLIEKQPDNQEYIGYRARILSRKGSHIDALADYDRLLKLEPFNADFIGDRAVVMHLLNRNEEAMSELDRALNLEPNNPYRYSSRAFLKDRLGDFQGAIDDYEKAIAIDPEDAVAFNNKGLVEEKLGYREKSINSFKIADRLAHGNKELKTEADVSKQPEIPPQLRKAQAAKKLTISGYLSTLGKVFTDRETRNDFFRFLFSRSRDKKQ